MHLPARGGGDREALGGPPRGWLGKARTEAETGTGLGALSEPPPSPLPPPRRETKGFHSVPCNARGPRSVWIFPPCGPLWGGFTYVLLAQLNRHAWGTQAKRPPERQAEGLCLREGPTWPSFRDSYLSVSCQEHGPLLAPWPLSKSFPAPKCPWNPSSFRFCPHTPKSE